jgi:DNA-binding response OmpR family regulator
MRGTRLGADAYVTKPYSLKEIVSLAEEIITRRKSGIDLSEGSVSGVRH